MARVTSPWNLTGVPHAHTQCTEAPTSWVDHRAQGPKRGACSGPRTTTAHQCGSTSVTLVSRTYL